MGNTHPLIVLLCAGRSGGLRLPIVKRTSGFTKRTCMFRPGLRLSNPSLDVVVRRCLDSDLLSLINIIQRMQGRYIKINFQHCNNSHELLRLNILGGIWFTNTVYYLGYQYARWCRQQEGESAGHDQANHDKYTDP